VCAYVRERDGLVMQSHHSPDDGDMVPETSVMFNQLTQLITQEDFINVSHCESFTSYTTDYNVVMLVTK
jgi:hypothetical protein